MTETQSQKPPEPSSAAGKRKRAPTKTSWKKGVSGNPAGRKPTGQSWGEVWRAVTDKTPGELAADVGGPSTELGRSLAMLPQDVPIKYLVATRVVAAIMREPSASLLNSMINSESLATIEERLTALEARALEAGVLENRVPNYP